MNRIDTLIPYRESEWKPATRLGKLDLKATAHAISAKLGRYLTHDIDEKTREQLAQTLAETISGQHVEPYIPEPGSLRAHLAEQMTDPLTFVTENGTMVYAADKMPARTKGHTKGWHWAHRANPERFDAIGFRIDTAAGAMDILGDGNTDILRRITSETKYSLNMTERITFDMLAIARWDGEIARDANRRFSEAHNAGVFTDKKQCDSAHRVAAERSAFNMFSHVEIDDDIDLDLFAALDREFAARWKSGELPRIDMGNAFRFRKTGRHSSKTHRTIGVYSPNLHAIAVDPRAPRSLLHEFAHAFDYEHGQLSCGSGFAPLLNAYRDALDMDGMGDAESRYALTPTEVFARAWEVYAFRHGRGGSFVATDYSHDPLYAPLLDMGADLDSYFGLIA